MRLILDNIPEQYHEDLVELIKRLETPEVSEHKIADETMKLLRDAAAIISPLLDEAERLENNALRLKTRHAARDRAVEYAKFMLAFSSLTRVIPRPPNPED